MLKGEYSIRYTFNNMFCSYTIEYSNHNIITNGGLKYFMERLAYGVGKNISHIGLGDKTQLIDENNTKLANSKVFNVPEISVINNKISFITYFNAKEANGCCEIGLFTDELLVTYDLFERLSLPRTGLVNITYEISMSNESNIHNWYPVQGNKYKFYVLTSSRVKNVTETIKDSVIDFKQVQDLSSMQECTYYQDLMNNTLYVMINDEFINEHEINIQH